MTLLVAGSLALTVSAQTVEAVDPCDSDPNCPQTVQIEVSDPCDNDPSCLSDDEIGEPDPCSFDPSACETNEEIE